MVYFKFAKHEFDTRELNEWRRVLPYLPPENILQTNFYKKYNLMYKLCGVKEIYIFFESQCENDAQKVLWFQNWIGAGGTTDQFRKPWTDIYKEQDIIKVHQIALWMNSSTGL